ncbi:MULTISPECIES: sensor histidine kinase [unclassified Amycolatopsis]|uniref:sensor histidine kinase n=1 Tax=unclassified Amycolatopsis TaxID=2618356 RepID=UPI002E251336|nr:MULTISPECIES: sensor histidine kinase [unclassified Amycolatopsis]
MMGVVPGALDARGERLAGPIFTGVGLVGLAVCAFFAAGRDADWGTTLVVVLLTAAWLPLLIPLFPHRTAHPWLTAGYYAGVLAAALVLVARNDVFTGFASFGYPLAFVLFPARWGFFAVAATAVLPMLVTGSDRQSPVWVLVASVAGPLLYAAWFVGAESEKRRKTNTRLEAALAENAGLHAQLLTRAREAGVLDERQRMAREIHDTLAQGLTGIVTQLQAADREDGPDRDRRLAQVRTLARDSLSEARRAVQALRPEPLAGSRLLPEALSDLADRVAETSGVVVRAETTGDVRPLLPEVEVTLYRVAQEALANAEKHAKASRIGLTLSYSDEVVLLDVVDDGVGFSPGDRGEGTGFGLETMRHRVQRVAGTLSVESAPGSGTAVNAQVPALPAIP